MQEDKQLRYYPFLKRRGFFHRRVGENCFKACSEKEVSKSFIYLCNVSTGEPAMADTVTNFLRENPGCIRGAPSGDYVYLKE